MTIILADRVRQVHLVICLSNRHKRSNPVLSYYKQLLEISASDVGFCCRYSLDVIGHSKILTPLLQPLIENQCDPPNVKSFEQS